MKKMNTVQFISIGGILTTIAVIFQSAPFCQLCSQNLGTLRYPLNAKKPPETLSFQRLSTLISY